VILLQGLQSLFIPLDGRLQLTDVLGATLSKGGLGLTIALLPFLGGSIDLERRLIKVEP
jgi:hypothetical protein